MTKSTRASAQLPVQHPGELLLDWIVDNGQTQSWLADSLGVTMKHINSIVRGRALYSDRIAVRLGEITDKPATYWAEARMKYRLSELSQKKDTK